MAGELQLGQYTIQRDPRGIRLTRPPMEGLPPASPLFCIMMHEPNKAASYVHIERLTPSADGGVDIHGFQTDRISLDGNIMYRPDLDGMELSLQLLNVSHDMNVRIGVYLELTNEADPRWMIPGLFYRENRVPACQHLYPMYHEFGFDPTRFVSSYWAFRADRAALPMVAAWTYGCFAFLSTSEVFGTSPDHPDGAGMSGLYLALEDGNPRLGAEFPYREMPVKYSFCHEDGADPDESFLHLPKRQPLVLNTVIGFGAPDLHAYDPVVRALYSRTQRFHKTSPRMMPEEAERNAHMALLRWHYDPRNAAIYETAAFDKAFGLRGTHVNRAHMHVGWQSGVLPAYAVLWGGREAKHQASIDAGISVLNKITSELSPAGTLLPVWTEEFGWSCSFGPEEGTAHSRTVAEAVFFLIRAIRLEMQHRTPHSNWLDAVASSINYAMAAQRPDGAFPAYFDLTTGRPTSFDGLAGIAWIPAMVASSALMQRPHFREVLTNAGNYYMEMLNDEFLYGSVEDQPLVPTCDDAHWALIAYSALYEFDRDAKWLAMAKKAADLAMTWRFAYNTTFGDDSILGRLGFKTRGGDILSVASPVLTANGLVCYGELVKLAALTGDRYFRERAEDSREFATQFVARTEGDLNARIGMTIGQASHTDWLEPKGRYQLLSSAYHCGLVRYAELVKRSLNLPLSVFEGQEESSLALEMGSAPVLYSETSLSLPGAEHGADAYTPLPLPSIKSFSRLDKEDSAPVSKERLNAPTPLAIPTGFLTELLTGGGGSPRGRGGEAEKKKITPPPRNATPPGGFSLPQEVADSMKEDEGGEEIKYKIF